MLTDPPKPLDPSPEAERAATPLGIWVVVFAACLTMFIPFPLRHPPGLGEVARIGLLFGGMWGQITAAAAWFALRPGTWFVRGRESLLWCGAIYLTFGISTLLFEPQGPGGWLELVVVIGLCLCGQWILIQAPLWFLRRFYGVQLSRTAAADPTGPLQFGMRHLLLFTTAIGAVLGLGRLLVISGVLFPSDGNTLAIFALLTIASLLSALPTILAVWMRRWTAAALLIAIVFGGGVLAAEVQWWRQLEPPSVPLLYSVHAVQIGWILLVGVTARAYGYRLIRLG